MRGWPLAALVKCHTAAVSRSDAADGKRQRLAAEVRLTRSILTCEIYLAGRIHGMVWRARRGHREKKIMQISVAQKSPES